MGSLWGKRVCERAYISPLVARINTHIGAGQRNRLTLRTQADPWSLGGVVGHAAGAAANAVHATENHASGSAGYHSDLSIPGYQPKTPTVAPSPGEAASAPAGNYAGAGSEYHRALVALPPPRLVSLAAPTTGAAPESPLSTLAAAVGAGAGRPLSALSPALQAILGDAKPATPALQEPSPSKADVNEAIDHAIKAANIPATQPGALAAYEKIGKQVEAHLGAKGGALNAPGTAGGIATSGAPNPADPLGAKTVGNITGAQLAQAQKEGTLKINAGGRLTTPPIRQALSALGQAREQVAQSGPDLAALGKQFPELSPEVLKSYADASRRTGVPAPLLAGIENAESTYGTSTLPGVHSGQNFAGAAGPFQIGNGTGASGDAWQGLAQELWGAKADQHSIYDQHDAAMAAGQYLSHTYAHATKDPATWNAAALAYNHSPSYAQGVVATAEQHSALAKVGLPPNPNAVQALQVAKHNAKAQGINPTPFNGDVTGSHGQTIFIRADAQGAVHWAESALGTGEGSPKQLHWAGKFGLGSSEPWCANFVSAMLSRRGVAPPSNPNYTGSFESGWAGGKNIGTNLAHAKPGDLVTFSGEHIGVYVGNGEMISGNFGNEVARSPVSAGPAPLSAIIRPDYKGGKIAVHESAALAGSTAASTFGGGEAVAGGAAAGAPSGPVSRPSVALTPLTAPNAAGPLTPGDVAAASSPDQHVESAAQNLLTLLGGEEGVLGPAAIRGRPYLPASA